MCSSRTRKFLGLSIAKRVDPARFPPPPCLMRNHRAGKPGSGRAPLVRHGRRALALCLALACSLSAAPAESDPAIARPEVNGLTRWDMERRLLVMPFESEDAPPDLAYMHKALAEALAARLRAFGHIIVRARRSQIRIHPRGPRRPQQPAPGAGSPAVGKAAEHLQRVSLEARVITWNKDNYRAGKLYNDRDRARLLEADVLVSGTLHRGAPAAPDIRLGRPLTLSLRVYAADSGRTVSIRLALRERSALRDVEGAALEIIRFLSVLAPVPVLLESEPDAALVFADARYLGRSPLRASLVPGKYTVEFRAEKYRSLRRELVVRRGSPEETLIVRLQKETGTAGLSVVSDPPGADVFLDSEKIGKTPLVRNDLFPGTHRLRVAREGSIDRIVGVELVNGKTRSVRLTLRAGDTATQYAHARRAFLDWTWYDLHFYSLISGLLSYGLYAYYQVEEDRVEDRVRWDFNLAASVLTQRTTLGSVSNELYALEVQRLQKNRRVAAGVRNLQATSLATGVVAIVAAAAFLYLDLRTQPETGELQGFFRPGASQLWAGFARSGTDDQSRSEVGFSIAF